MDIHNERQVRFSKAAQLLVDLLKKQNPEVEGLIREWWLKSEYNMIGSNVVQHYIERIVRT